MGTAASTGLHGGQSHGHDAEIGWQSNEGHNAQKKSQQTQQDKPDEIGESRQDTGTEGGSSAAPSSPTAVPYPLPALAPTMPIGQAVSTVLAVNCPRQSAGGHCCTTSAAGSYVARHAKLP